MFVLGIIIGYLICGVIVLICNSINIDEDIKDIILGWWLIPIIIPINKIKKHLTK
jgi:ribose/xylose/arabinose/galactoside ABC-type transport system permease subunit